MKNLEFGKNMIDLRELKKIAIVRTDRLGDMILTLPMAKSIKDNFPDLSISMIANSYNEALFIKNPYIDNYFLIDKIAGGINQLFKSQKFDIVFYPMPIFNEVFAGFKSGIKFRIGSAFRLYSFLFNFKIHDHRKISEFHEAEYNTRMVNKFFNIDTKPELIKPFIDNESRRIGNDLFKTIDKSKKTIILHPGSRASARDWSVENFAELASKLQNRFNILITGTDSEKKSCNYIHSKSPNSYNLAGKFKLNELMAIIERSDLMVANSTGVLHLAGAIGIRTIGLYPNTPHIGPIRWRPYSKLSKIISPIYTNVKDIDNMDLIPVCKVEETIINFLS